MNNRILPRSHSSVNPDCPGLDTLDLYLPGKLTEKAALFASSFSAMPEASANEEAPRRPWLSVHTGTHRAVSLYEHGVQVESLRITGQRFNPKKSPRGKISTFSLKASRRMREFLLFNERPDCHMFGATWTLPGEYDGDLWINLMKRARMSAVRHSVSYVWRVELQKRGVPHVHLVAWVPYKGSPEIQARYMDAIASVTSDWFNRLPEERKGIKGAYAHCVHFKTVTSEKNTSRDLTRWMKYLGCHNSKHKTSQMGWQGKQWGIVGRRWFKRSVPHVTIRFTEHQKAVFVRYLSKLLGWNLPGRSGFTRYAMQHSTERLMRWIEREVE